MIHAFLAHFSCRQGGCQKKHSNEGGYSHGQAWQDISLLVEKGVREYFRLGLCLNRRWAYVFELVKNPWVSVLEKAPAWLWGFEKEEIVREVWCCFWVARDDLGMRRGCTVNLNPIERTH